MSRPFQFFPAADLASLLYHQHKGRLLIRIVLMPPWRLGSVDLAPDHDAIPARFNSRVNLRSLRRGSQRASTLSSSSTDPSRKAFSRHSNALSFSPSPA